MTTKLGMLVSRTIEQAGLPREECAFVVIGPEIDPVSWFDDGP